MSIQADRSLHSTRKTAPIFFRYGRTKPCRAARAGKTTDEGSDHRRGARRETSNGTGTRLPRFPSRPCGPGGGRGGKRAEGRVGAGRAGEGRQGRGPAGPRNRGEEGH